MQTFNLTRAELDSFAVQIGAQLYYLDGAGKAHALTATGGRSYRWIDADDRPGEVPRNGDGWTVPTQEFSAAPVTDEQRAEIVDAHRLRMIAREFSPAYLDALDELERGERLRAELDAADSAQGITRTRRAVKVGGHWTTEPIPAPQDDPDTL